MVQEPVHKRTDFTFPQNLIQGGQGYLTTSGVSWSHQPSTASYSSLTDIRQRG